MKRISFCKCVCFFLLLCCFTLPACQHVSKNEPGSTEKIGTTTAASTTAANTTQPEPQELELRFASYNIKHGQQANLDMTKLAKNIIDLELDVVGLQEVDQLTTRVNGIDTMKELSDATGYPYYCFFKTINYKGGEYGIGVLSKYPIVDTEKISLYTPSGMEKRVLGRAEINANGVLVQFFVTHLSYESADVRKVQFDEVATAVAAYENFVLTGDFNTSNFTEYAVIKNAGMVNNAQKNVVTMPKNSNSIDNIVYATDYWSFGDPIAFEQSYSDHYLLYSVATYKRAE